MGDLGFPEFLDYFQVNDVSVTNDNYSILVQPLSVEERVEFTSSF